MSLVTRSEHRVHGGVQGFYEHESAACQGPMRFGVYLPPQALGGQRVPALYFLAGLTATEETFAQKAGAQRIAAELGLALVTCDTSPRAARFPGDDDSWDFGQGAGFYLDATLAPWSAAYRMETYVTRDLREAVESRFLVRDDRRGILGHSMGGHGALTLALRHPGLYHSLSALAPIVAPSQVPWGQKAFQGYLGDDAPGGPAGLEGLSRWGQHDACELVKVRTFPGEILLDQGTEDKFLERELQPERFRAACALSGQALQRRLHRGYDHSYFFVATFIEDHLRHHAQILLE